MTQALRTRVLHARAQRGAVALFLAVLMLLVISTALLGALRLSGTALVDTVAHDEQAAALFLGESGIERAHAALAAEVLGTRYTAEDCPALVMSSASPLGRGSFQVVETALTAGANCVSSSGKCDFCRVNVVGRVGQAQRVLSALFEIPLTPGVEGRSSSTDSLFMKIVPPGGAATVTSLTLRSKDGGGSSATVDACNFSTAALDGNCVASWVDNNTGEGKVVGLGVLATALPVGQYGLSASFTNNQGGPASRPYALVGALLYPRTGSVVVSQGRQTLSQTTSANAICGGSNLVNGLARAALSDTLVYGFSGLKAVLDMAMVDQVGLSSADSTPPQLLMSQLAHMVGTAWESDRLYGQLWYTHNPAWSAAAVTGAAGSAQLTLTAPGALPAVGTVLAGSGFSPGMSNAVGRIVGDRLVLSGAATLFPGDVVSGPNIRGFTRVVSTVSSTEHVVTPAGTPEAAVNGPVVARAAVLSASGTTLVLSRPLAASFSGSVCGGMCAFFYNGAGSQALAFQRLHQGAALPTADKWASGYECLSGVEPAAVQPLLPPVRRVAWSELLP